MPAIRVVCAVSVLARNASIGTVQCSFEACTLPIAGATSYRELLGHVQKAVRGAMDNADVPFQQVVADADMPRSASYSPLFQSMVTLQESGLADRMQLDGLTIGDAEVGIGGGLSGN